MKIQYATTAAIALLIGATFDSFSITGLDEPESEVSTFATEEEVLSSPIKDAILNVKESLDARIKYLTHLQAQYQKLSQEE